jgi:hypothetical protein
MLVTRTAEFGSRLLLDRAIGFSFLGWAVFLACAALYCIVYNQFVLITPTTFFDSFIWSLKEYASWLVITPLFASQLRRIHQRKGPSFITLYAKLLITTLSVALIAGVCLEMFLQPHRSFIASAIDLFPAQLSVLAFIAIIWEVLLRTGLLQPLKVAEDKQNIMAQREQQSSVLVMKGNGERLISWDSVDFICAAGNYMELTCASEKFLLRVSMKQLEQDLPSGCFIRIHRSYIVNIAAIDRIIAQPAGNGTIALRNQHVLPLSKRYKQALNVYKFVPNSSQ